MNRTSRERKRNAGLSISKVFQFASPDGRAAELAKIAPCPTFEAPSVSEGVQLPITGGGFPPRKRGKIINSTRGSGRLTARIAELRELEFSIRKRCSSDSWKMNPLAVTRGPAYLLRLWIALPSLIQHFQLMRTPWILIGFPFYFLLLFSPMFERWKTHPKENHLFLGSENV